MIDKNNLNIVFIIKIVWIKFEIQLMIDKDNYKNIEDKKLKDNISNIFSQ